VATIAKFRRVAGKVEVKLCNIAYTMSLRVLYG